MRKKKPKIKFRSAPALALATPQFKNRIVPTKKMKEAFKRVKATPKDIE
jgi:hypothetical protein